MCALYCGSRCYDVTNFQKMGIACLTNIHGGLAAVGLVKYIHNHRVLFGQ